MKDQNTFDKIVAMISHKPYLTKSDKIIIKTALKELNERNKSSIKYAESHLLNEYVERSNIEYLLKILRGETKDSLSLLIEDYEKGCESNEK